MRPAGIPSRSERLPSLVRHGAALVRPPAPLGPSDLSSRRSPAGRHCRRSPAGRRGGRGAAAREAHSARERSRAMPPASCAALIAAAVIAVCAASTPCNQAITSVPRGVSPSALPACGPLGEHANSFDLPARCIWASVAESSSPRQPKVAARVRRWSSHGGTTLLPAPGDWTGRRLR